MDESEKELLKKDPFAMTYDELGKYIDLIIDDKFGLRCLTPVQKDTFFHLKYYFRLQQLQINLLHAKAGVNQSYIKAIVGLMPEEVRNAITDVAAKTEQERMDRIVKSIGKEAWKELKDLGFIDRLEKAHKKNGGGKL